MAAVKEDNCQELVAVGHHVQAILTRTVVHTHALVAVVLPLVHSHAEQAVIAIVIVQAICAGLTVLVQQLQTHVIPTQNVTMATHVRMIGVRGLLTLILCAIMTTGLLAMTVVIVGHVMVQVIVIIFVQGQSRAASA
jgi:hypothetical protein